MNIIKLRSMLNDFYLEDIGDRDLTSELIFSSENMGELSFVAKQSGVFCGEWIIREGFHLLDHNIQVQIMVQDGTNIEKGQIIAIAKGAVVHLLKGERVILNLIQRMSGIATKTANIMNLIEGTNTKICDTRKTMPGLRVLDKYSVRVGGGANHRNGLYDAVLIKDNHIAFAGSITQAISKVKAGLGHMVKVEVEIETKEQLLEAIEAGADIIMFDNRSPHEISEWLLEVPDRIITEASGNITSKNVREYAESGVQYISLGSLTHSVEAFDISAKVLIKY
ncbi:carboxylating nicotinate-nucleotide diphosphorylase [Bacillus sp. FJAT-49736]|uniref:carboxylating nicotinate-nucleotide diphosphorylase n=1 Tax=Bacillus sp. FJAT-49736 TaxID=2833582 RepID=UPI001BC9A98D|nr:carboxylating nicotinate-nucleotide diphosphorylase [Bacillus sp. FJAT-49736]MBS4173682.1 carboxylating nicotinate-nucleotide diphosphorylase [Bacillus sp. FJAT-49736]